MSEKVEGVTIETIEALTTEYRAVRADLIRDLWNIANSSEVQDTVREVAYQQLGNVLFGRVVNKKSDAFIPEQWAADQLATIQEVQVRKMKDVDASSGIPGRDGEHGLTGVTGATGPKGEFRVPPWKIDQIYKKGECVTYGCGIYVSLKSDNKGKCPSTFIDYWKHISLRVMTVNKESSIRDLCLILLDSDATDDEKYAALITVADILFPGKAIFRDITEASIWPPTPGMIDTAIDSFHRSAEALEHQGGDNEPFLAAIACIEWALGRSSTVKYIPCYIAVTLDKEAE